MSKRPFGGKGTGNVPKHKSNNSRFTGTKCVRSLPIPIIPQKSERIKKKSCVRIGLQAVRPYDPDQLRKPLRILRMCSHHARSPFRYDLLTNAALSGRGTRRSAGRPADLFPARDDVSSLEGPVATRRELRRGYRPNRKASFQKPLSRGRS